MDTLVYYVNNLGPQIVRTLTDPLTGNVFDIQAGDSFHLRMRQRYSSAVILDKVMVPDVAANTVSYTPASGDAPFTTEGVYRAWVFYVNASQDIEEFEILVLQHAPGEGTTVGAIWRAARALEPVSWDALRGYSDYGDVELQRVIELAKLRVLPTAVDADGEANLDPRVVDYVAKKVLVDNVLSAAISFWTNQTISQSARGNTEEVVTYPDRIRAAEAAILRYASDLERQLPEVTGVLGTVADAYDVPMVDTIGPLLTPGLEEYQAQRITPQRYRGRTTRW